MILDLLRALSFFLSILSLYWMTVSAFFVPGSRWQDRLILALLRLALAACICFFSGLLFSWPSRRSSRSPEPLVSTLPVQLFFWTTGAVSILFVSSWYLATASCGLNPAGACTF